MMRIIIHDGDPCYFPFVLEAAVCSGEASQSLYDHVVRNLKKLCQCNGCQSIGYIVASWYFQIKAAGFFAIL